MNKKQKKIFLTEIINRFLNKKPILEFDLSEKELMIVLEALEASKDFHNELNDQSATVESAVLKLGKKHINALKFEKTFGVSWPI